MSCRCPWANICRPKSFCPAARPSIRQLRSSSDVINSQATRPTSPKVRSTIRYPCTRTEWTAIWMAAPTKSCRMATLVIATTTTTTAVWRETKLMAKLRRKMASDSAVAPNRCRPSRESFLQVRLSTEIRRISIKNVRVRLATTVRSQEARCSLLVRVFPMEMRPFPRWRKTAPSLVPAAASIRSAVSPRMDFARQTPKWNVNKWVSDCSFSSVCQIEVDASGFVACANKYDLIINQFPYNHTLRNLSKCSCLFQFFISIFPQAHQNRILEQERERVERLRLEEILTACADYEKQAQCDRINKPQVR